MKIDVAVGDLRGIMEFDKKMNFYRHLDCTGHFESDLSIGDKARCTECNLIVSGEDIYNSFQSEGQGKDKTDCR